MQQADFRMQIKPLQEPEILVSQPSYGALSSFFCLPLRTSKPGNRKDTLFVILKNIAEFGFAIDRTSEVGFDEIITGKHSVSATLIATALFIYAVCCNLFRPDNIFTVFYRGMTDRRWNHSLKNSPMAKGQVLEERRMNLRKGKQIH
ncbi:unnamed protein product [Dovyalis caffra]|uniref:Uncharacterized protein n=1 Tax=Dovyalis caffra TaxID=77055 RepID=A0AAV1RNC3_9ROSI|nr:unnamed protein product [Dovyalis caffra]